MQASLVLVPLYVLETGSGGATLAAFLLGVRGTGMLLFDMIIIIIWQGSNRDQSLGAKVF